MLTIDWKERLEKDTLDYIETKLPVHDYDFDIIFNAYPERVGGRIPSEVIVFVSRFLVSRLGKRHEQYLPFYRYLWAKKGEPGRNGFITMLSRLLPKKPAVYLSLFEEAMHSATPFELASMLERVILPLLRKSSEEYLPYVYKWAVQPDEELRKASANLLIKLMKREPDLIERIVTHYTNQWLKPLGDCQPQHVMLLKAVYKLDKDIYVKVWHEHGHLRDPETVEILCGALMGYTKEIEGFVQTWTLSGNARVKKAAVLAMRILKKKKKG